MNNMTQVMTEVKENIDPALYIQNNKILNVSRIIDHCRYKIEKWDKLCDRASGMDELIASQERRHLYRNFEHRAYQLIFLVRRTKRIFNQPLDWKIYDEDWWKRREKDRIETGRYAFENKHKYQPWFMSLSLGADYGSFYCEKCWRSFYHSPSKILLAGKEIHNCVCGYCTNELIENAWDNEPYQ